jgi:hypothetical protein
LVGSTVKGLIDMQSNIIDIKHLRISLSLQETENRLNESLTLPALKQRNRPKELPTDTSVMYLIARSGRSGLVRVLDSGGV